MRLLYPAPVLNRSPHSQPVSGGRLKALLAGLTLFGLGALPAHAQLNYPTNQVTSIAGTYTDLGTNGTQIIMQNAPGGSTDLDDDGLSDPMPIGFTFQYEGANYTDFVMSTNGFIKLGSVLPSSEFLNGNGPFDIRLSAMASTDPLDGQIIAPFNHDLTPGSAGTNEYRVFTSGTAPNRVCTIQWKDMADFPTSTGPTVYNSMNFQVKLYEGTNVIEFVYDSFVPGTLAVQKAVVVGLKGTSNMPNEVVWLRKASGVSWAAPLSTTSQNGTNNPPTTNIFVNNAPPGGLGGGSSPTRGFQIQTNVAPTSGRTFRFTPVAPITNNASVFVYTLSQIASPSATPHVVRARVTNTTGGSIAGRNVTLNITGPGGFVFNDVKPVPSLAAGASTVISFAGYSPTTAGNYSVSVTLPADDNNADNTSNFTTTVTVDPNEALSYSSAANSVGGVGFTGACGQFVARFTVTQPTAVNRATVEFFQSGATTAQPYRIVIFDATGAGGTPGNLIYQSPQLTSNPPATAGTSAVSTYAIAPAVPVNGDFFLGIFQTQTTNIGFAYESEDPIRNGSFYFRGSTACNLTTWNDFATANSPFRFNVTAGIAPPGTPTAAPNCVNYQIPANNATNVDRAGTIQWSVSATGAAPDGFDVYLSTNQSDVQNEVAGARVSTNQPTVTYAYSGLLPLTTYYYKVVARNAVGSATGCSTVMFTTGPGAPANDECASATSLTLKPVFTFYGAPGSYSTTAGTTQGASESAVADPTCSNGTNQDVWYTFNPGNNNGVYLMFASTGSGTAFGWEVYNACGGAAVANSCSSYTGWTPGDTLNYEMIGGLMPNTAYRLRVFTNTSLGVTGPFRLALSYPDDVTLPGGFAPIADDVLGTLTINAGATVTLPGGLTAARVRVNDGGTLNMGTNVVNSIDFRVNAGGTLGIGSPQGIAASGNTGNVQGSGTRFFSNDATYNYNYLLAQSTGSGLPSTVRSISSGVGRLSLTNPLSVRRLVTVNSGNFNASLTSGRLTLLSDDNMTAMVVNAGSGVVQGTVRVQRSIDGSVNPGLGYRHISSPVQSTTLADLTTAGFTPRVNAAYNDQALRPGLTYYTFPNTFRYVESQVNATRGIDFDEGWFSPASTAETMTPGRGYTINIGSTPKPDFLGTLNNGNVVISGLTNTAGDATESGWNFIGNPYPAPMDWDQVPPASLTSAGLSAQIAVFRSSDINNGVWNNYVNGVGPTGTDLLPLAQGFMVRKTAVGTSSFTLTNASRVTSYTNVQLQRSQETRPLVQLTLNRAGSTVKDNAFVYFEQGATPSFDAMYDADKIRSVGEAPTLYTRSGSTMLGINGQPELGNAEIRIPLGAEVSVTGQYVLNAEQLLNFATGQEVILEDALTGTSQDLRQNPQYVFNATAGNNAPRFTLVFRTAGVTGTNNDVLAQQLSVFPNPVSKQALNVQLAGLTKGEQAIQARLVNALGQVVLTRTIQVANGAASAALDVRSLASGVYTLQVVAGESTATRTVVVE